MILHSDDASAYNESQGKVRMQEQVAEEQEEMPTRVFVEMRIVFHLLARIGSRVD